MTDQGQPGILQDYAFFLNQTAAGGFVTVARSRDRIVVFDPSGRIRTVVGEPGQFGRLGNLVPWRDGLFVVFDHQLRRSFALGRDLRVEGTVPIPYNPVFALQDGRFIVAQQILTRDLSGYPIHLIDGDGRVLRSFGLDPPQWRSDLQHVMARVVAPGSAGGVWAAPPGRYVFELWDPASGKRLREVNVKQSWFAESSHTGDERVRPSPLIQSLWERGGLVWTLIRVADANWKAPAQANIERPFDLDEYHRTFDWMLEVVRPDTGDVIASRRLPIAHWGRPPSPLLVSRGSSAVGEPMAFHVWLPELRQKKEETQ